MLKIKDKDGKKIAVLKDDDSEPEMLEPKKTVREVAKELGIEINEEEGQERLDLITGKRISNE